MKVNIIKYYLNNPMANFQYMQIHLKDIPNEVVVGYSLLSIADKAFVGYAAGFLESQTPEKGPAN